MKRSLLIFLVFSLAQFTVADLIFDVDFDNPPHVLDAAVAAGIASDRPSSVVPNVVVRDSLGDFTTHFASFEGGGIMGFNPSAVFSSGVALFSWDMAMLSTGGIELEQARVSIDPEPATGGSSLIFHFMLGGDIEFNGSVISTYTFGLHDTFEVAVDLDNDLFDVNLNSSAVLTDQPLIPDWSPDLVVFGGGFLADPRYVVDNFTWLTVPEPSTFLFTLLGLLLVVRNRRRVG